MSLIINTLAARLAIFHLRKKAFKSFTPPSLIHHVINLTDLGIYDKDILNKYNKTEFKELDNYIDHWRDMNFSYAAVKAIRRQIFSSKSCNWRNF